MKKVICIAAALAMLLCGCQAAPGKEVVVNKNVENFEKLLQQQADGPGEPVTVSRHSSFPSLDGKTEIVWDVETTVQQDVYPVIEVVPDPLTEAEAKKTAETLFPNSTFYDYGHEFTRIEMYSKDYYRKLIDRRLPYTDLAAFNKLVGPNGGDYKLFLENLDKITQLMETAGDNPKLPVCDWVYKHDNDYMDFSADEVDPSDHVLYAITDREDASYVVIANNGNGDLHLSNSFSIRRTDPAEMGMEIMLSELCRTDPPTEEQVRTAEKKAQEILDKLDFGIWKVTGSDVSEEDFDKGTYISERIAVGAELPEEVLNWKQNGCKEYAIYVNAAPVLEGYTLNSVQSLAVDQTEEFSPYYRMSHAGVDFAPNGEILNIGVSSMLESKGVINPKVKTVPLESMYDTIETQLSFWDMEEDEEIMLEMWEDAEKAPIGCRVIIKELKYGFGRVAVPNKKGHYYYLPVLTVNGDVEYYGTKSNTIYFSSDGYIGELLVLNAVDGSVVGQ